MEFRLEPPMGPMTPFIQFLEEGSFFMWPAVRDTVDGEDLPPDRSGIPSGREGV
jgi:hypothetical protein